MAICRRILLRLQLYTDLAWSGITVGFSGPTPFSNLTPADRLRIWSRNGVEMNNANHNGVSPINSQSCE